MRPLVMLIALTAALAGITRLSGMSQRAFLTVSIVLALMRRFVFPSVPIAPTDRIPQPVCLRASRAIQPDEGDSDDEYERFADIEPDQDIPNPNRKAAEKQLVVSKRYRGQSPALLGDEYPQFTLAARISEISMDSILVRDLLFLRHHHPDILFARLVVCRRPEGLEMSVFVQSGKKWLRCRRPSQLTQN